MNVKEKLLAQAKNDDEKIIIGRAIDLVEKAKKNNTPALTSFLDPNSVMLYEVVINTLKDVSYESFGGVEDAERKRLSIYSDDCFWYEPKFEIEALRITMKEQKQLNHRDFMGSILGLGLKRDVIGDIIAEEDNSYVFVDSKIADFIENNLTKVGSVNIEIERVDFSNISKPDTEYQTMNITIVSPRLDSIMAKAFQLSRSAAANFVKQGKVKINHRQENSPASTVKEGDTISCRGRGRCVILKDLGLNKKGKLRLEIGFPVN